MAEASIEQVDGEFWVDSGHADVGPFDTEGLAQEHIDRMVRDRMEYSASLALKNDMTYWTKGIAS